MKIFTDILPLLSDLKTMTRFEIKARLPEGTCVDHHPDLEHDFQYVWDGIIAMWEELEWIHLPVIHIQPDELANDVKCSNGRIKVFVVIMDQFME